MLMRSPLAGFVRPAQPVLAEKVPSGDGWLHELKRDGFPDSRHKDASACTSGRRNGRDWSVEFSGITAALNAWKLISFVLDARRAPATRRALG
jgi:bifunctional non-homologous end joining protein LigD